MVVVSTATTAKEHLEHLTGVSMKPTSSWVVELLYVCSLIISCLLLLVREHRVGLAYVLKSLLSFELHAFLSTAMLVRMPPEGLPLISLLDLILCGGLPICEFEYLVVVLPF